MKWTYTIKNKIAASGTLFLLCLLVLFSNYIDRNHTENVKKAISTLYEDRLIAEEYILKMTSGVYQVIQLINTDSNAANQVNSINILMLNIREENNAYQKTKFTAIEKKKAQELVFVLGEFESISLNNAQLKLEVANKILDKLNELSTIQLEESKNIMEHAEALYLSGESSSQFVFILIIIILLVLQALVFTSKTLVPNSKTKFPNLN